MKIGMRKADEDLNGLVDEQGRLTTAGRNRLLDLAEDIEAVLFGHKDNTVATCRIDLRGHDCCYTCNAVEDMLRATLEYFDEFQQEMREGRKVKP